MAPNPKTWLLPASHPQNLIPISSHPDAKNLDEISHSLPQGAYTTFRTFGRTHAIQLDRHLSRLEESAEIIGFKPSLDRALVRRAILDAVAAFQDGEARIRLTLDLSREPGDVYISIEALVTPAEQQVLSGVSVITQRMQRQNPKAKLTDFISSASGVRREMPEGVYEAIMVDENGRFLEGLSSNFFAIGGGELWTADEGVLPGITRSLVLEEAEKMGLVIHLKGFPADQIAAINEAFITSSTRAVLPVTAINDFRIGDGRPGPITKALLERYLERLDEIVMPI